ncbi:MAG TPA: PIG-L family deacetylase [Aggregatilineales bacterium]|nr:PIG-L family deacetylase [Anaerolineales bacterium]HRE49019.1 PIG-L family deacetylase [Aggregatilineales bacterium]
MSDQPSLEIKTVMAIYAHPDDPEFFSGGLLAKWGMAGKRLIYVLATSGDKGTDDPTMTADQLTALREAEQRAAAACAGDSTVIFLRYGDGTLAHTLDLRRDLTRVIRQHRPDVVITNDPATYYFKNGGINHPDHMAIGAAALAAVYPSARDRHTFEELWRNEGLEPHKVRQVYLSGTWHPTHKINITDVFERKIAAINEHHSQVKDPEGLLSRMRGSFEPDFGETEPIYVENYRVITLRV